MARSLAAFAIVIGLLFSTLRFSRSEEKTVAKIQLTEILQGRVEVVGLLGQPIGKILRLKGFWRERPFGKGSSAEFVINNVNETQLAMPIILDSNFVHGEDPRGRRLDLVLGETWEMIAYEGIQVSSQEALNQALGKPLNQNPFDGLRGFISGVVVRASNSTK
jgi:hypothetical protein